MAHSAVIGIFWAGLSGEVPWGWEGMRGSHFENQACGRGQGGRQLLASSKVLGGRDVCSSWAGWKCWEQSLLSFFSIKAQGPLLSSGFMGSFSRWLHFYEAAQGSQSIKAPATISEGSCHIYWLRQSQANTQIQQRWEINISCMRMPKQLGVIFISFHTK